MVKFNIIIPIDTKHYESDKNGYDESLLLGSLRATDNLPPEQQLFSVSPPTRQPSHTDNAGHTGAAAAVESVAKFRISPAVVEPPSRITTSSKSSPPKPSLRRAGSESAMTAALQSHIRSQSATAMSSSVSFSSSLFTTSSVMGAELIAEHFLIPAFVHACPSRTISDLFDDLTANSSGHMILERVFTFNRYAPPSLVHKIFSKMLPDASKDTKSLDGSSKTKSFNCCWDKAFRLKHVIMNPKYLEPRYLHVVVFLEPHDVSSSDGVSSSGVGNNATAARSSSTTMASSWSSQSKKTIPEFALSVTGENVNKKLQSSGTLSGVVNNNNSTNSDTAHHMATRLVIRCRGHIFQSHKMIERLNNYCRVTEQVLEEYPGLRGMELTSTCPRCISDGKVSSQQGTFRQSVLDSLNTLYTQFAYASKSIASKEEKMEDFIRMNSHKLRCSVACRVKPELLISIPEQLETAIVAKRKSEHKIHFLLDVVVQSASTSTSSIKNCLVKVMSVLIPRSQLLESRKATVGKQKIDCQMVDLGSGVFVDIYGPRVVSSCTEIACYVITCEHIFTMMAQSPPVSRNPDPENYDLLALVGGIAFSSGCYLIVVPVRNENLFVLLYCTYCY
jgi:hypothetical protein